jgi:ketosteroid isomerase-like protein
MKQLLFLLLLTISLGVRVTAQTKDEAAVAAAVEQLRKALLDPDKAALEHLTAPELSYGHSGGKIEDQVSFINALVSGTSDFVTIDLSQQTIKVVGKTAMVRHLLNGTNSDAGKPGVIKIAVLLVWVKQGNDWKLLARQAVKI